jgi:release factor glutamine methyltransferase
MGATAIEERVREALGRGAAALAVAGADTPRLDAELLLAEAIGVSRERLVLAAGELVCAEDRTRYDALLRRREAREPVAYILGRKAFRRLELSVDRRVLIPRPESELLVEVGLTVPAGARVADAGTGSGAIALALKDERPDLTVVGIDVDAGAIEVARGNGSRLGIDVEFVNADLLDRSDYDAVLANLPYVAAGATLEPEIALYEPPRALFAGADGLDLIRRLLDRVGRVGRVGLLALEVGCDQAAAVCELVRARGFSSVSTLRDLAGIERAVVGRP